MTGKDWIENVTETLQDKQMKLERDEERLQTLRADVITTTAIKYDSDKVQSSCSDDMIMQKYALMDEISKRMLKSMEEYNIYKSNAIHRLNRLVKNPTLAYILEARHINFMTNAQIGEELNLKDRAVHYKFNKAYDLLNSIYILEKYRKSC